MIALFVGISGAYWLGYKMGDAKANQAPTPTAWINERQYAIDADKEIAKYDIDKYHEYRMAALNRGVLIEAPEEEGSLAPGCEIQDGHIKNIKKEK